MSINKEKLGVDKVIRNSLDYCDLYIIQKGDKVFLLYLFEREKYYYFKIMPEIIGKWEDCENVLYTAIGLFGFVNKQDELEQKIREKMEALIKNVNT
ncbi:conserved hypothetical protein [Sulfolobus islandicus Y.G.57.14]|uniref:Uncharacterized protein n=7 Tax=Saccharolobus islandicus TaxID=43080 RepID=C3MK41_SACI2|nr:MULTISPECIES: hypothetical protein [Sulfolobaceae]ACP34339.1 conserved hypothetical protein [Sulfolobus islandicus L.S.2.15]ACP37044.1 conserved hypothetical protein [Sulfolobus islandicus M.14.25]ACP44450.1 conserved hypothetical protein [Sulfolobus islandicus Y.G.57.14]ACP54183.1 conserved hypothetical protein [Sulfolobus islandicus M.16.27]ACR40806.1 conserved hypothetical protein [Sulfolobus islandicus M.16.4]